MNFRTTLFLLVLVVAVGIAIFLKSRHDENNPVPDKIEARKLVDFDTSDVARVSIVNYDDKHIVLQKTGNDWNLVEPVAARAKMFEVDDMVRALTELKSRSRVDASKKTSGGLDHPSFVVELTTKGGKTVKLSFGDNSSVGDSLYVLVNDAAQPDVVGNSVYAILDKPPGNYRDTKLVSTPGGEIKQIAITEKDKTIRLEKKGENWEITAPSNIPAETSAVTDLLSGITGLDATEFVDSPSAAARGSLAHPRLSVSFSTAAPTTQPATTQPGGETQLPGGQTIRFGGYKDILKQSIFASLNGKDVAVVPAMAEKAFEKTPLDLRNRDVLEIAPDRVSSFMIAIDRPATTQPTTRPADIREFTIERHKVEAPVLGPALSGGGAGVPSTQPASPTTLPAVATSQQSEPETKPAVATTGPAATQPGELAAAKWIFASGGSGAADEGQVTDLLADLHPLRVEKYLEPEKAAGATYTLKIHVIPATAADSAEDLVLTFLDTGTRLDGYYKDLHFEVNRGLIEKLTGDFKTKKAAPPEMPPQFHGAGGMPFGG